MNGTFSTHLLRHRILNFVPEKKSGNSLYRLLIFLDFRRSRHRALSWFGLVEMGSADEVPAAIEKFNGMDHDGRSLAVKEALPREGGGGGGGGVDRR